LRPLALVGRDDGVVADRITVFLLDDHEIVRRGLRDLLEAEGDIDVVGEAATEAEAVGRVHALDPDVAVLDVRLEEGNGVEACREIRSRHPRTACLILTSFADDEALFQAIMAGAAGYVVKQIRSSDLVDAVRRVAAGQNLLDPVVTARVLERIRHGPAQDERLVRLTEQERNVRSPASIAATCPGPCHRSADVVIATSAPTISAFTTSVPFATPEVAAKRHREAAAARWRSSASGDAAPIDG
jgi:two-component system response regulator DevR